MSTYWRYYCIFSIFLKENRLYSIYWFWYTDVTHACHKGYCKAYSYLLVFLPKQLFRFEWVLTSFMQNEINLEFVLSKLILFIINRVSHPTNALVLNFVSTYCYSWISMLLLTLLLVIMCHYSKIKGHDSLYHSLKSPMTCCKGYLKLMSKWTVSVMSCEWKR